MEREITDAEMLAALLPNSPADLHRNDRRAFAHVPATPATLPATAPVALTVAYRPGPDGTLVPVYIPQHLPATGATPRNSQPVPAWAKGAAVVSVGVGAGAWLLAGALGLASSAVAGIAAGASAALPLLILAGVAVAAVAGRRGGGQRGSVNVTQSVTHTITTAITNSVKIGD